MTSPHRKNARQPPWEPEADESVSFGAWLRRQREMREISLREIADSSKISLRYLEAFEQDRFDMLPAPVFARGFLRKYAQYVGLDPDEVMNNYLRERQALEGDGEDEPGEEPGRARAASVPGWPVGVALALVVVLVLLGVAYLAFRGERGRGAAKPAPPAVEEPAAAEAPPPAAREAVEPEPEGGGAPAPIRVTLDFVDSCWVEPLIDGRPGIEKLYVQGESLQLEAEESVVLTLGNAAAVSLEVNGMPMVLPSTRGRPLRDLRIDLDVARSLAAESP